MDNFLKREHIDLIIHFLYIFQSMYRWNYYKKYDFFIVKKILQFV